MKSGFVCILGKPNVGKSTLLNHILKRKISIVTNKSQTTRNAIKGIYNDNDSQIVFIDTPGVHVAKQKLGEEMNSVALNSTKDADAIIYVIDCGDKFQKNSEKIITKIQKSNLPLIIVYNKIDLVKITDAIALKEKYKDIFKNAIEIDMVASEGFNVDKLIETIKEILPEGPQYYDVETVSDQDEVFQIKEIIREKALKILKEEVPHSLAVYMNDITWEENPMTIQATIVVEKESQKIIVIGKDGKRIKQIGSLARQSIEALLHKHVFLKLFVKVDDDWRNTNKSLEMYGYKTKK